MTLSELTRVLVRYWQVVLVGALLTVASGFAAVTQDGVYVTRTNIVFLAPTSSDYPNALRTQSEDIIDTAGLVGKRVSGPKRVTKFASPDVTLLGLDVRDGWSLRLPDTGGQWATNFATQTLVLDAVGPSREAVKARQTEVIRRVEEELGQLQREAGVGPANSITALPAPESTVIYYAGGNRPRALGMTAVLGPCVTIAVALALNRRRRYGATAAGRVGGVTVRASAQGN